MGASLSNETEVDLPARTDMTSLARELFSALQTATDDIVRSNRNVKIRNEFHVLDLAPAPLVRPAASVRELRAPNPGELWKRADAVRMRPTHFFARVKLSYAGGGDSGREISNAVDLRIAPPRGDRRRGRLRVRFDCDDPEMAASARTLIESAIRGRSRTVSAQPRTKENRTQPTVGPAASSLAVHSDAPRTPGVNWRDKVADGAIAVVAGVIAAIITRALGFG
ncbi:hypothetical protein MIPYR_50230 [uncultured Microbacterium sp.]|uniref:Uncharacterized protein n=2 Tax=uncultured Microbacterium sp. TaxID=191216 RepID=A0A1Y5P666_9MICO|nr:hypothetical protein MIPYR_50230 [uncultured Microbacterium sp.]